MKKVIVFDLDGTLCDVEHRRRYVRTEPKNWDAFNSACVLDEPIPHVVFLFNVLWDAGHEIFFFSGRTSTHREETIRWLEKHLGLADWQVVPRLWMRGENDRRPDNLVKKDFLDEVRAKGYEVFFSVDDRNQVVDMWRENGVPCFQAAPGDF